VTEHNSPRGGISWDEHFMSGDSVFGRKFTIHFTAAISHIGPKRLGPLITLIECTVYILKQYQTDEQRALNNR